MTAGRMAAPTTQVRRVVCNSPLLLSQANNRLVSGPASARVLLHSARFSGLRSIRSIPAPESSSSSRWFPARCTKALSSVSSAWSISESQRSRLYGCLPVISPPQRGRSSSDQSWIRSKTKGPGRDRGRGRWCPCRHRSG